MKRMLQAGICAGLLAASLIHGQARTGVITGKVLAPNGAPAAGVRVAAVETQPSASGGAAFAAIAESDKSGGYRLENIPPGRYAIVAGAIGAPTYYPGVRTIAEATAVSVAAGPPLNGIDFRLLDEPGVRVSGRVTPEDPRAFGLIRVSLTGPAERVANAAVNAEGLFEFVRVLPGIYRAEVVLPDGQMFPSQTVFVQEVDLRGIALEGPVVVSGRAAVEGDASLPVSAMAAAFEDPTNDTLVGVAARSGAFQSQARAARDGTFVLFTGGPAARISAQTLPLGYFVKSLTYGNIDLLRSPLTLDAPASGEILLTLTTTPPTTGPRGFSVSGKITGIPETARSRVALVLHGPSADDPRTERAIEPGQTAFEIRNVPPGAYSLGIVGPDVPRDTSSFRSVVVIDGDVHNADLAVTMH